MPPPFTVDRDNGRRAKTLRRRRDYIAGSASSRSLPSVIAMSTSAGARSWFEMPPADRLHRHDRVNPRWLYACRLNAGAPLSAIEQSRGSEYSPGTGRKSRLFSATKPILCFALELRFAIKSLPRTLSFDTRWRLASILYTRGQSQAMTVPQTWRKATTYSLYNSWTRKNYEKDYKISKE